MERVAKLSWSLLGLSLVLLQLHGVQGRWLAELPPCNQVVGGIPGFDCYDPPTHPLPPCDFLHQRIGFDCSGWPPASKAIAGSKSESQGGSRVQGELPPCNQVIGGVPGFDCYDPPTHPLPPCDFLHQRIGFDCSGWPPASKAIAGSKSESQGGSRVQGELPPCNQVIGGVPGFDCYDPPTHPLPPCDFLHQRIGFDCSGWPPAAAH